MGLEAGHKTSISRYWMWGWKLAARQAPVGTGRGGWKVAIVHEPPGISLRPPRGGRVLPVANHSTIGRQGSTTGRHTNTYGGKILKKM